MQSSESPTAPQDANRHYNNNTNNNNNPNKPPDGSNVLTPPPPRNLPRGATTHRRIISTPPSITSLPITTNNTNDTSSQHGPPPSSQRVSFVPRRSGTFYATPPRPPLNPTSKDRTDLGDSKGGAVGGGGENGTRELPRLRRGSTTMFREGGFHMKAASTTVVPPPLQIQQQQQQLQQGVDKGGKKDGVGGGLKRGSTMLYKTITSNLWGDGKVKEDKGMGEEEGLSVEEIEERRRVEEERKEWEKEGKMRWECCGMCGACGKYPYWAPERLKTKGREEVDRVEKVMMEKEERGKLERSMREKRMQDWEREEKEKVENEMDQAFVDSSAEEEEGSFDEEGDGGERVGSSNEEEEERRMEGLQEVDLGSEDDHVKEAPRSKEPRGGKSNIVPVIAEKTGNNTQEIDHKKERVHGHSHEAHANHCSAEDGNCEACNSLETKVKDLEEQVELLKGIVDLTRKNAAQNETDKKNKGWKYKMLGTYYGSGVSTSEKNNLRGEAEALRKTTDAMFHKVQNSEGAD